MLDERGELGRWDDREVARLSKDLAHLVAGAELHEVEPYVVGVRRVLSEITAVSCDKRNETSGVENAGDPGGEVEDGGGGADRLGPLCVRADATVAKLDAVRAVGNDGIEAVLPHHQELFDEPLGVNDVIIDGDDSRSRARYLAKLIPVLRMWPVVAVGAADLDATVDEPL